MAFGVTYPEDSITTDFFTSKHSREEIMNGIAVLKARDQKVVMSINGNPN
ncbi:MULTISPECIES: hypothetical protein [unclassified Paenibacillus]|uniref:Diaminopimelate decarboxylase n=1 Tax=Paenibacillus provencensis TaxID=441151 RepID=A0ABW3PM27_9BACL|nr:MULTISPECIES: hypothetical protein [unclassified Paenibacillus]MCM3131017.1 hypothetical protein [Paenibacillus sp. MER 78]